MISKEQALEYIDGLSTERLRDMTVRRLLGEETTCVGSSYFSEGSEELIFRLLQVDDGRLESTKRAAIIDGCRDVYLQLYNAISTEYTERTNRPHWDEVALRLGSVFDIATPEEFRADAHSWLALVSGLPDVNPEMLEAAVWALTGYRDHVPTWVELLDKRDVSAYAFNALVDIDPNMPEIERSLKKLWPRQVEEDWPVDTAFLMRRAVREQGHKGLIERVLSSLRKKECWPKVRKELERWEWSRGWVEPAKIASRWYDRESASLDELIQSLDRQQSYGKAEQPFAVSGKLNRVSCRGAYTWRFPRNQRKEAVRDFSTRWLNQVKDLCFVSNSSDTRGLRKQFYEIAIQLSVWYEGYLTEESSTLTEFAVSEKRQAKQSVNTSII